ncbi:hypothetical protein [Undibacterium sp.]|nr:hypothetical protein [Undibacterium sp.]HTD03280.1 hypothetical protein [Undibacterium sp.]
MKGRTVLSGPQRRNTGSHRHVGSQATGNSRVFPYASIDLNGLD